jgi:chemotaxis protein MotB
MAAEGITDFSRRNAMRGKPSIRSAFPGNPNRPASGRFTAVLCAAVLFAAVLLGAGCSTSKKVQRPEPEAAAVAAEEEKKAQQQQALQQALDEANTKITELERQVEELSVAKEKQETVSEQEIAQVKQTYDSLVKELKGEVESGKIKIERSAGQVKLNIAEELFFETGMTEIKQDGQKLLLRIGKDLQKVPGMNIRVEGHTDNVPIGPSLKEEYPTNWELSASRAVNVVRFLQEKARIDPKRLSAVAFGPYRPVASNETEAGKQRNRRVEIVLIDKGFDTAKKTKATTKK